MTRASHRTIDLERKKDKPGNVYRYIEDWEAIPSTPPSGSLVFVPAGLRKPGLRAANRLDGASFSP